jgi:hypothetical protein
LHTAVPGFQEKILTTLLNHDDELGMKEIVFGIPLPRAARSNMCFVVRVVAVVVAGKHMWVGQHFEVGKPVEEEHGIVVRGLRT